MTPAKQSVEFTPMKGLLNIGRAVAHHFGLAEVWDGHDGFEGVLRQKLCELGVPEKPITLSRDGMTPRQMAEQSGFLKRPRRRLKGK